MSLHIHFPAVSLIDVMQSAQQALSSLMVYSSSMLLTRIEGGHDLQWTAAQGACASSSCRCTTSRCGICWHQRGPAAMRPAVCWNTLPSSTMAMVRDTNASMHMWQSK